VNNSNFDQLLQGIPMFDIDITADIQHDEEITIIPPADPCLDSAEVILNEPLNAGAPVFEKEGAASEVIEKVIETDGTDGTDEADAPAVASHADDGRLILRHLPSEIRHARDIVLACLAKTGKLFEQGGSVVTVRRDSVSGETEVCAVNSAELMLVIDEVVAWERFDARKSSFVRSAPPEKFCSTLIRTNLGGVLPPLAGIVQQPFLRADGSVCATPGYDPSSQLYGSFDAPRWIMPEHPSQADAEAALGVLSGLLSEFPFVTDHDRAAALAAMLTATVRPSLPTAPMFHTRAHVPGSGKSYLCALITALASPRLASPLAFPGNNDECEKVLLAELRRGVPVIEFDNLTHDIAPYKKLCTVLTSDRVSGRVLGTSRTIAVSTKVLMLSNGNNVGPVGDMARRCITINLDARTETPATRIFDRAGLLEDVRNDRTRYVAAALTVVRGWLAAGSPGTVCTPVNSFDRWSDWCRQPLLWLGQPDPAASVFQAHEEDPYRMLLGRLLKIWHERFGSAPVMARDLVAWTQEPLEAGNHEELDIRELLNEIAGTDRGAINRRSLGWWLKARTGQVVNGLRLQRVPRQMNAQTWQVVSV
jgi:hypothetical protein